MRVEYKHNARPIERWAFAPGFPVHERFEAPCVEGYICDPRRCRDVHLPDVHPWIAMAYAAPIYRCRWCGQPFDVLTRDICCPHALREAPPLHDGNRSPTTARGDRQA